MKFIQKWRGENRDQEALYHEMPLEEVFSRFELPIITHEHCPRDKNHTGTFTDAGGRLRCAHKSLKLIKPSFIAEYSAGWDHHSQQKENEVYEDAPRDPSSIDDEGKLELTDDYDAYEENLAKYNLEEAVEILDVCYAIIQEPKDKPLAFETILTRLNIQPEVRTVYCRGSYGMGPCRRLDQLDAVDRLVYRASPFCPGHKDKTRQCEFEFDGWTMAYYLLKWKQQPGNPQWHADKKEHWPSREHVRICSED